MVSPGPNGKPAPGHDFGEFLRHTLHAAMDQVEPHGDGLERIRAKIQRKWFGFYALINW